MKYRGVEGGTPVGPPLCRTCHSSMYIKGKAEGQELLFCSKIDTWYDTPLPFEAYECSAYSDKRLPDLYDMKKVAWIIQSDALTKRVGFLPPKSPEHKKILEEE